LNSKSTPDAGMIYLVRAASTANDELNYPVLLNKNTTQVLSAKGKKQAEELVQHFAKQEIAAVYSSSQSSAIQTARAVRKDYDIPLTFCSSLVETDFGKWEGLSLTDTVRLAYHPKFLAGLGFPGTETLEQLAERTLKYITQLSIKHAHDRIVLISHEWALRAVVCKLCNVPFDRVREIEHEPGRITTVRVFRGHLELKSLNNDPAYIIEETEEALCATHLTTR